MTPEKAAMQGHVPSEAWMQPLDPPKQTKSPRRAMWWTSALIFILCLFWLGVEALVAKARAHIPDHHEWDDVLGASTNQENVNCCGKGDAHLLEFDEWRETKTGYEVFVLNELD